MNAMMNIRIQVMANQARQQMQQMGSSVTQLQTQMAAANATTARGTAIQKTAFQSLSKWGNQVQWTGRQLEYNFTLPIALAGAAATKFALDNEAAMVRVEKVYDKGTLSAAGYRTEIEALGRAFEAMSNRYGVVQADVIKIAADFAAAGSSGAALAKQTNLALQTMILGEVDAATATKALIAIQAQYNFSSDELADTIARLNNVENQTGTTMGDLIVSLSKSAGVARAAGVDVQHLAAMTAALTPAAGSAAEAGNSLKTIMARLLSPTQQAAQILKEVGIAVDETSWKSANANTRLEILSDKFAGLSDAQRAVASSTLASNWQVSRFEVLMDAIAQKGNAAGEGMSYYWKALKAASEETKNAAGRIQYLDQMTDELNTVLDSNPQKVKQVGVMLQNSMTKVIQPLLPTIMGLASSLGSLAEKIGNVDPALVKLIASFLLFVALLGPIARYAGSFATLIGILGRGFGSLTGLMGGAAGGVLTFGRANRAAAADAALLARANAITAATARTAALAQATATIAGAAGAASGGGGDDSRRTKATKSMRKQLTPIIGWFGILKIGSLKVITDMWAGLILRTKTGMLTMLATTKAGLTTMLKGMYARFAALLMPTWGATWARFNAIHQIAMIRWMTTTRAAIALNLAMWAANAKGVITRAVIAMGGALAATLTGLTGMLGALGPRLVAMGAMWAWHWGTIVTGTFNFFLRVQAAYLLGNTRLGGMMIAFRTIMFEIWTVMSLGLSRIWAVGMARVALITATVQAAVLARTAVFGPLLAAAYARANVMILTLTGGFGTAFATLHGGITAAVAAIWRAFHIGIIRLQMLGGSLLNAAWVKIGRVLSITHALILFRLRGLWLSFYAFMKSPAALAAAFKGMMAVMTAGGKGILGVLTFLRSAIIAVITSPWVIAIAAVIGLIVIFRTQLQQVWDNIVTYFQDANNGIVKAFNRLPEGVTNALIAVVNVVKTAALKVYEWFSYLNPFAHHSPSLVENVTNGMAAVRKGFGTLTQVSGPIQDAYVGIKKLKDAAGNLVGTMDQLKRSKDRGDIAQVDPSVLPAYDSLVRTLGVLKTKQDSLEAVTTTWERRVKVLDIALQDANDELDRQKDILDKLQTVADGYKNQIDSLNDAISELASTPLAGIGAMEDQIWANEMAQKALRLEILKLGAEGGQSYDQLRDKIASIQGEIETLTGNRENLRSAGAGSEILGFYDQQIEALQKQKKALNQAGAPVEKMQKELDALQTQAEIMDLEKALKFDPLTRQIEKAASTMKELPFNEIMAGINSNKNALVPLEAQWAAANAAIAQQEGAVARAQAVHDQIQASYDAENLKLTVLKQSYDDVSTAVSSVEENLNAMATAARDAIAAAEEAAGGKEYVSPALQNFRDAAGGDFADVSGTGLLGREGTDAENLAGIDELTKSLEDELGNAFGEFDMLAPFKDMWNGVVNWWNSNVVPWFGPIGEFFTTIFDGVDFGSVFGDLFEGGFGGIDWAGIWDGIWEQIVSTIQTVWQFGALIWDLLGPDFQNTINNVILFFDELWIVLKDMWSDVTERAAPFMQALGNLWDIIVGVGTVITGVLIMGLQNLWSIFNAVLEPAIHMIIGVFQNLWNIVMGVVDVFIGLFTLDFGRFFGGLGSILGGIIGIIWDVIVGIGSMIWGAIQGLATGIWDNMVWLATMLWDGFKSGIENAWNAITGWFSGIWNGVIDWIKDLLGIHSPSTVMAEIGSFLIEGFVNGIESMWTTITDWFGRLKDWLVEKVGQIGDKFTWLWDHSVGWFIDRFVNGLTVWKDRFVELKDWFVEKVGEIGDKFNWLWDKSVGWFIDRFVTGLGVWKTRFLELKDWFVEKVGEIGDKFLWLWDKSIGWVIDKVKEGWEALGTKIESVYNTYIKPIIGAFETVVSNLKTAFDTAVGAIGTAWDTIKSKMATPINFVINTVLNNGLIKGFNTVVGFFGLDSWKIGELAPIAGYATGGQVKGYSPTPTADNIRANLTAGEYVQPVKAVDRYGKGFMDAIRTGRYPLEAARNYASGGYVDMFNRIKQEFPQARLNSSYRPGDPGFHGQGLAVDIGKMGVAGGAGNQFMANVNQWVYDTRKAQTAELIYNGLGDNRPNVKNGNDLAYSAAIQAQHKNHVHIASRQIAAWVAANGGASPFAGASTSGSADVKPSWWSDPVAYIRGMFENLLPQVPGSGKIVDWAKKTPGRLLDNTKDWLLNKINPLGWFNGADTQVVGKDIPMGGNRGDNVNIVKEIAAQRGWGDGQQWRDLYSLVTKESGFNNTAQNPTSTAYGMFQFLNSTWAGTGIRKTSDPRLQAEAGMRYIKGRYTNPSAAWAFHRGHNHYDAGGILEDGQFGHNKSGKPERVLDPSQTAAFERLVNIMDKGADSALSAAFSSIVRDFAPSARVMEEAMMRADAEMRSASQRASSEMDGDVTVNNVTINIYGNLEFPNIKDGDDSNVFIKNLHDLANGR